MFPMFTLLLYCYVDVRGLFIPSFYHIYIFGSFIPCFCHALHSVGLFIPYVGQVYLLGLYPPCIMLYSWGYLYHFIYHGVALSVGQAILKLGPVPFMWSAPLCE